MSVVELSGAYCQYKGTLCAKFCNEGTEKKVQVGKDQEKAQSERDSHSKNRGGKKPN